MAGERTPLKVAGRRLGDFLFGGVSRSAGGSNGETAAGVCVPGVFAAASLCPWDGGAWMCLKPSCLVLGSLWCSGGSETPRLVHLAALLPKGWLLYLVSALKRWRACAIQTPARLCLQTASCLLFGSWVKVEVRFSTLGAPGSTRYWEEPQG